MENLTVKLEQPGELILREGYAPKIYEPNAITTSGDIRSVGNFVAGRKSVDNLQKVDPDTTLITVDKEKGTIVLQTNPNDQFGTTVQANLQGSDELKEFSINKEKTYSQKQLIKILKFNKLHFSDPAVQEDLLKQYMAFSFKTNLEGHANSDNQGNKSQAIQKAVDTNIPKFFSLMVPIYKGEESRVFKVEICLDVTDAGATFWFESIELHELEQIEKEIIFKRELERCAGLVIIYK